MHLKKFKKIVESLQNIIAFLLTQLLGHFLFYHGDRSSMRNIVFSHRILILKDNVILVGVL